MRGGLRHPDRLVCGPIRWAAPTSGIRAGTISGMHPVDIVDELLAAAVIDLLEDRAVCTVCRVDLGPLASAGLVVENTAWHTFATSLIPGRWRG